MAEQGFPGYDAPPWSGFFVPKGTPKALVDKISNDMREVMSDPVAKQKMIDAGSEFTPTSPEDFRKFVQGQIDTWAKAVQISGAQID